ncbi:MAG TPA: spondin domain-containing protein [Planctomycetota bacterium]
MASSALYPIATLVVGLTILSSGAARAQNCDPALAARYEVVFESTWSASTHPADFPPGPHMSGLVGGTRRAGVSFWNLGGLASAGIESMAETGSKTALIAEVNAAITAGDVEFVLSGGGIGTSPGSVTMQFDVTSDFSRVTLVSMIAPQPRLVRGRVGIRSVRRRPFPRLRRGRPRALRRGHRQRHQLHRRNNNTNPADPITQITGYPFFGVPLGTFTFTKLQGECLGLCVTNLVAGQTATVEVSHGTPGEMVAVLWSTSLGSYQASSGGWCVDFGIALPGNPLSRLVAMGACDANGDFVHTATVPAALQGRAFQFQSAEKNTCPDPCMSRVVAATVQ